MDRTSWIDPAVMDWVQHHAIAIQIDVDAEPAVAKQLEIRAMPTVIAFKEGVEVDQSLDSNSRTRCFPGSAGSCAARLRSPSYVLRLRSRLA